jgi:glycosyltransferase involved in cell wall biosynthesis
MSPPAPVIFVNRFYWPDESATAQLLTDLAEALAAAGRPVGVVTTRSPSGENAPSRHGVDIHRVCAANIHRRGNLARIAEFLRFHCAAAAAVFRLARAGTTVVAMTDPPLLGLSIWVAARLRRARVIHWAQDIYPEIAITILGHRSLRLLCPIRNHVWRHSQACVAPGADMAATIRHGTRGRVRIVTAPNWAPAGLQPPPEEAVATLRREWQLEHRWVAAYSGNLGRVHELRPLLDVAAALAADPDFALLFIGAGAQRAGLEQAVRERALRNVFFQPPQPRSRLDVTLGVADVHFVTLRAGAEASVYPSKLYGIAAVGRPVIFLGHPACELATTVRAGGFGAAFPAHDAAAVAAAVRTLRADPALAQQQARAALRFAARGFDAARTAWLELLAPPTASG